MRVVKEALAPVFRFTKLWLTGPAIAVAGFSVVHSYWADVPGWLVEWNAAPWLVSVAVAVPSLLAALTTFLILMCVYFCGRLVIAEGRLRPKLEIVFDASSHEFVRDTPYNQTAANNARFIRVCVFAKNAPVKSCRAFVTSIKKLDGSTVFETPFSDSQQLSWAASHDINAAYSTRDIFKLPIRQFFDVICSIKDEVGLKLQTRIDLHVNRGILTPPGTYLIGVAVASEDGSTVSKTLRVTWAGVWDTLSVKEER